MSAPLKPESIQNFGIKGLIRPAQVDDNLIPEGAVTEVQNFHFDQMGVATTRLGLAGLGSTVLNARPAIGLTAVNGGTAIVVFSNGGSSTIYSYGTSSAAGAWAVGLDGGTGSVKIRFANFAGYTVVPNFIYNTLSSMRFWDGGTRNWKNTGNPINPQNMWGYNLNFIEVYKSRLYGAGDPTYPSRLFFSSVITSAGNITWAPTTDWVDINPGDGEDTTGLKNYSLELLLFKPNFIYRFKTSGVDPDPLIKIGTRSHESLVEGKKGLYFHHDTGFYQYTGGYPTEISRPIIDFIQAIPYSQFSSITGWKDPDHIYWSVGNLTIAETSSNVLWKNVVLRYTESSQVWTIYAYPSDIRYGLTYNSGTTLTQIVATDYGVVATQNSGTTDLGEPIKCRVRTKWYAWGGIVTFKNISRMASLSEKTLGFEIMAQVDDSTAWKSIGQITKFLTFHKNLNLNFHRIRFQITGITKSEASIFRAIEILDGINQGILENV